MLSGKNKENNRLVAFARGEVSGKNVVLGIKSDDRRRHMYILGKTGMGKTTLMETLAVQDMRAGRGVCFIDVHGDSIPKLLNMVPSGRINDVVYLNPADTDFPVAFNILEAVDPKFKHLVADGILQVFTKLWPGVWSARMEYILSNTVRALLDTPGSTLLGVNRLYADKNYRKRVVAKIQDPLVKMFWEEEYAHYDLGYAREAVAPIQNKVGQFLASKLIRNIVGQSVSTVDLRKIMDNRQILLVDLSKGRIGEDNAALLGGLLMAKLQLAALSRVDIVDEDARPDFYVYVDEFQTFATESFSVILSEARKYHLNLILAHQHLSQLTIGGDMRLRDSILGNVGTIACFRLGAQDASVLEPEFAPQFKAGSAVNLPKFSILLRLMVDGRAAPPLRVDTLKSPANWQTGNANKVIQVSRERYARPVAEVENKIARWMNNGQETLVELETKFSKQGSVKTLDTSPLATASLDGGI